MPHVREAVAASHDRHDRLLVAALASGDLAGADRDQALALTSSCADCAALHADLVAIARATVTLPPPVASAGRDFRLTPAQAASLRRTGWRRFLPSVGAMPLSRPLGAALATFGIAGLLIGTQPLGFVGNLGTSAASPASAAQEIGGAAASSANDRAAELVPAAASAPAASAEAVVPMPSAAASMAPVPVNAGASAAASAIPDAGSPQQLRGSAGGGTAFGPLGSPVASSRDQNTATGGSPATAGSSAETKDGLFGTVAPSSPASPSPLVLLSLAALVVGVVLLVASYRGRRTAR